MTSNIIRPSRRAFVGGALGAAALSTLPAFARKAEAAGDFKIGLFIALIGTGLAVRPDPEGVRRACRRRDQQGRRHHGPQGHPVPD